MKSGTGSLKILFDLYFLARKLSLFVLGWILDDDLFYLLILVVQLVIQFISQIQLIHALGLIRV